MAQEVCVTVGAEDRVWRGDLGEKGDDQDENPGVATAR